MTTLPRLLHGLALDPADAIRILRRQPDAAAALAVARPMEEL